MKQFTHSAQCAEWSQIGTITPDHVIRTKGFPMLLHGVSSFLSFSGSKEKLTALSNFCMKALDQYEEKYHQYFVRNNDGSKIELDPLPRIILIDGIGLVTIGKSLKSSQHLRRHIRAYRSCDYELHGIGRIQTSFRATPF